MQVRERSGRGASWALVLLVVLGLVALLLGVAIVAVLLLQVPPSSAPAPAPSAPTATATAIATADPVPMATSSDPAPSPSAPARPPLPKPLDGEGIYLCGRVSPPQEGVVVARTWEVKDGWLDAAGTTHARGARTGPAGRFVFPVRPAGRRGTRDLGWGCVLGVDAAQQRGFLLATQLGITAPELLPLTRVRLQLLNAATGAPAARIEVYIHARQPAEAYALVRGWTDGEGRFSVPLPPGSYELFVPRAIELEQWRRPFAVLADSGPERDLGSLRVPSSPIGRLAGKPAPAWTATHVHWPGPTPGGKPAAQVRLADLRGRWVLLGFKCPPGIHAAWTSRFTHLADAFALVQVEWGRERGLEQVFARLQRQQNFRISLPPSWPIVFEAGIEGTTWRRYGLRSYPTDVLIDPQGRVATGGAERLFQEILPRLARERAPPWRVSGVVRDATGAPVGGVTLAHRWEALREGMEPLGPSTRSDAAGRFRYGLAQAPTGRGGVYLLALDAERRRAALSPRLRSGDAVSLTLEPAVEVTGRFTHRTLGLIPPGGVGIRIPKDWTVIASGWRGDGAFRFLLPPARLRVSKVPSRHFVGWGRNIDLRGAKHELGTLALRRHGWVRYLGKRLPRLKVTDVANLPEGLTRRQVEEQGLRAFEGRWLALDVLERFDARRVAYLKRCAKIHRVRVAMLLMDKTAGGLREATGGDPARLGVPVILDGSPETRATYRLMRATLLALDPEGRVMRGDPSAAFSRRAPRGE